MIIHEPEIIHQNGHSILGTRIELKKKVNGFFPEYVWYRVPDPYGEYLTRHSDAFLIPGLLGGMYFGEDIEVRGSVSPRLAYQLDEYQFILRFRFPDLLQQVDIKYDRLAHLNAEPKGVGTTFTGGVDSLFTLWNHLPENQPNSDYQVTHGLFIKGFDILPSAKDNYQLLYDQFVLGGDGLSLEIIQLETNIVGISHLRLALSFFYGPYIIASAISLAGLFRRFFMPSSWDYKYLREKSYTSDPLVDPLLSTDTMDIIHHGSTHPRVGKLQVIADWELAQNILWVCQEHKFSRFGWNCSRCDKCNRTMIPLYVLGKLSKFKMFSKPYKKDLDTLWWIRKFSMRHDFVTEMFPFIKKHRPDFIPWFRIIVLFGVIRNFLVTRLPTIAKQFLRRFGYYVTRNEAPDSYEIAEITHIIRSKHDHPST
jgi:hypothetical protein